MISEVPVDTSDPQPDGQTPRKSILAKLVLEILLTLLTLVVFAMFPSEWTLLVVVSGTCVVLIVLGLVLALRKGKDAQK
jgi:heme/copper-type cytochrome/quinol oxidase subunit 4